MKQLTTALTTVLKSLDTIDEAIKSAVEKVRTNKQVLMDEIIDRLRGQEEVSIYDRIQGEQQVNDSIELAIKKMQESRRVCDRLRRVTRNSLEIAKTLERGWREALKSAIKETKWYKERFPRAVEKEQREKQYERYRMRPDLYYQDWLGGHERGPEDVRVPSRSGILQRRVITAAILDEVSEAIQKANSAIMDLIGQYFSKSEDNPLLKASNAVVKSLRRKPILDELRQQGREDQVRVLETLFGFKNQPGQFIEVGGEAFLAPALQELNLAREVLADPVGAAKEIADIQSKLERFQRGEDDSPPGEEGPGGTPPEEGIDPSGAPEGETEPLEEKEMELLDLTSPTVSGVPDQFKFREELERQSQPKQQEFDPEKTQKIEWEGFDPETEVFHRKPQWKKQPKQQPKEPPTEGELQRVLERQGRLIRRQQRYQIAQRIASN